MLVESLIRKTIGLQGFRVVTVKEDTGGLVVELAADRRYDSPEKRYVFPPK